MNPYISSQLADERRRDMLADAQKRSLVRQVSADLGTTRRRRRHLRAAGRARAAALA